MYLAEALKIVKKKGWVALKGGYPQITQITQIVGVCRLRRGGLKDILDTD